MEIIREFVRTRTKDKFEEREDQEKMAAAVNKAIRSHNPAFIEGGTGNGKTFSYLIPLLEHLHNNPKAKAAISSSTILLQDQLLSKDIPEAMDFFRQKYGKDFKLSMSDVVKLVGINNFTCEDSPVFDEHAPSQKTILMEGLISAANLKTLKGMAKIARQQKTPIFRRDIGFNVPYDAWEEIGCSGVGGCRCHEKGSEKRCSYKATINEAVDARLLVANHSYLAANSFLALNGRSVVVVDEAHKLPEVLSRLSRIQTAVSVGQVGADDGIRRPSKPLLAQRFHTAMRAWPDVGRFAPCDGHFQVAPTPIISRNLKGFEHPLDPPFTISALAEAVEESAPSSEQN